MNKANVPLVTVYITNHNYGRFLDQAIQSVLKQTLEDFELIIIDDGSSDNSREIIERYADREKVLVIFQQNKGLSVSNNIALRMARGRYLLRLDADDYLDENALLVLSGILERNPDIGMVFPDYFLVDEHGGILDHVCRHNFAEVTLLDQPAHGAGTLIRRQLLLEMGGYDEYFRCQDGYDLWIRFIQHYQVQNVNLPLFYYRRHAENLTRDEELILTTRAQILEKQVRKNGRQLSAVAIIPVRGHNIDSGSLPLRPLGGRALIDWTLEAALGAKRLSGVVVTSPDEELLKYVSQNYGERVLTVKRERKLASLNTQIEETIFHALKEYSANRPVPDAIAILFIESPFRTSRSIDNAMDVMEWFDTDIVVGVRPEIDVIYRHNGQGLETVRQVHTLRLEREELYREVGQMRLIKREFLEQQRQVEGGRVGHVVLDQRAAWRLRSEYDWELAECQANSQNNSQSERK
ncbi:MAG: hypothetical protein A2Y80_03040 [Deltaproteobacteria bacterium RBG_13_58_19]|nr:MAG: hypothetical protein A2Y80_03040 [Deltaproteobacteria bacterium RBG_13_58_19]